MAGRGVPTRPDSRPGRSPRLRGAGAQPGDLAARAAARGPGIPFRGQTGVPSAAPLGAHHPGLGQPSVPHRGGVEASRRARSRNPPGHAAMAAERRPRHHDRRRARPPRSSDRRRLHPAPACPPIHDQGSRAGGAGGRPGHPSVRRWGGPEDQSRAELVPGLPQLSRATDPRTPQPRRRLAGQARSLRAALVREAGAGCSVLTDDEWHRGVPAPPLGDRRLHPHARWL